VFSYNVSDGLPIQYSEWSAKMTDANATPNGKKKAGRPKAPPPAPALGIAERKGDGYGIVIVLGGMRVNGKKYDPQEAAENLADMFVYCMRVKDADPAEKMVAEADAERLPSPETPMADLPAAAPATSGAAASSEPAVAPGENGSH
jgi:hypothetical protein